MKQPRFWYQKNTFAEKLLKPFGFLYGWIVQFRIQHTKAYQPKTSLICVGNICVGGTGKTPLCLALADYFQAKGKNVYFLSHGYKSKLQNILIDPRTHTSQQVSDEALLFANKLPTVVNKNRAQGLQKAEKYGADLVIMDDGFQNPTVEKKCALVVFDGLRGIGNGSCMPAGPLRESLKQGLTRAAAAVIVGEDKHNLAQQIKELYPKLPILKGHVEPLMNLEKRKGIAFAGIGNPNKFFDMLEKNGVQVTQKISFPDHYAYTREDIEQLLALKQELFTTKKDAVKIDIDLQPKLTVVDIRFVFDVPEQWDAFFERKIK